MNAAEKFKIFEGCYDVDLCVEDACYGGIHAKKMLLPEGYFAVSHKHKYDHLSILAKGKCMLITDKGKEIFEAPKMIEIKAGVHHEIVALEDVLWFCLHATDDIADSVLIEKGGA
jgi:quercetin dioxygenase-like cupin family protein